MPVYACQWWSKYTQTSMKRLRAPCIDRACDVNHESAINESLLLLL